MEVYDELEKLKAANERLEVENAKIKNLLDRGIDIIETWKALKKALEGESDG